MGIVVAFTGLDGAGKSAQTKLLQDRFAATGRRVVMRHQYEPMTTVVALLKDWARPRLKPLLARAAVPGTVLPGEIGPTTEAVTESTGRPKLLVARLLGTYWLSRGLVRTWFTVLRFRRTSDLLILDRCFLDEIVRSEWRSGRPTTLGRMLVRLAPVPDVCFHMVVPTAVGWSRKKEINMGRLAYDRKHDIVTDVVEVARGTWPVRAVSVEARTAGEIAEDLYREVEILCTTS